MPTNEPKCIEYDTSSFPIVKINLLENKYVDDINLIKDAFEFVFETAKQRKMKACVYINCVNCDGMSTMTILYLAKYLKSIHDEIRKYIFKTAIIVEDSGWVIPTIMEYYTPVRPIQIYDERNTTTEIIKWLIEK